MSSSVPNMHNLPDIQGDDSFDDFMKSLQDNMLQTGQGTTIQESNQPNPYKLDPTVNETSFGEFINRIVETEEAKKQSKEVSVKDVVVEPAKEKEGTNPVEDLAKKLMGEQEEQSKQPTPAEISEEAYELAFTFIRENQLLHLPDGIEKLDGENLQEVLEYDQNVRNNAALEYIKSRAGDDYVAELFELVWQGGTREDLEEAKEVISDEQYLANLDLSNPDNQRNILFEYIKSGLNPNAPSYNDLLEEIPSRIESILGKYKGEEESRKAQQYFLQEIRDKKIQIDNQIRQREAAIEKQKAEMYQRELNWRNTFLKEVIADGWTTEKKNEVISHFNKVKLEDNTEMPLWEYKMKKIWENPSLTKELFRFLSDLDPYELKFKKTGKSVESAVTEKILSMASKKMPSRNNTVAEKDNIKRISDLTPEVFGKLIEANGYK